MSSANQKSARELIAELCDESLQREDRARLMQLLRDDPLLQNEYLDQAMVDGLLRYEFGIDRSTIPAQFVGNTNKPHATLIVGSLVFSLLACLFAGGYLWINRDKPLNIPIQLANLSFESDLPISTSPVLYGWYGDEAQIVAGSDDHFAPHGNRMLQLIRSVHQPSNECEVYQLLDLSLPRVDSGQLPLFIEAKMVANTHSTEVGASFVISLELYTYSELPELTNILVPRKSGGDIMVAANQIVADSDPESWQEVKLLMPINSGARYAIIKVSARDGSKMADDEFKEVFIDHVQIRMTNQGIF